MVDNPRQADDGYAPKPKLLHDCSEAERLKRFNAAEDAKKILQEAFERLDKLVVFQGPAPREKQPEFDGE